MELSERERRLLREMETHLRAEDPGLAATLNVRRLRAGTKAILAASGLVIGVLLMGVGVLRGHGLGIAVALAGYLFLLAAVNGVAQSATRKLRRSQPVDQDQH